MIADLLVPFAAILIAEFGDKTMLAILMFSSRVKNRALLLLGTMCGFLLVDGLAIFFGRVLVEWIPKAIICSFSGLLFIVIGVVALFFSKNEEESRQLKSNNSFWIGFSIIAVSEWGDKTQVASALFAAQYHPALVLVGAISALFIISAAAAYLGHLLSERMDSAIISKVSGFFFIVIGLTYLLPVIVSFRLT